MNYKILIPVVLMFSSSFSFASDNESENIYFNVGSDIISTQEMEKIKQKTTNTEGALFITGYSDDLGDAEYNMSLSEKRAESVLKAIQSFSSHTLVYYTFGGERAIECPYKEGLDEKYCNRVVNIK